MYPEVNKPVLWEHFEDRGYDHYLHYGVDRKTGDYKKVPGEHTTEAIKEAIYREYHTYIENHGLREVHDEILQQCLDIEEDMTDFDLFVAGGYALLGTKSPFRIVQSKETHKVSDFLRKRVYR